MIKLKPCPFCGHEVIEKKGFVGMKFFSCTHCKALVSFDNSVCNKYPEKAIDHFNRRVKDGTIN